MNTMMSISRFLVWMMAVFCLGKAIFFFYWILACMSRVVKDWTNMVEWMICLYVTIDFVTMIMVRGFMKSTNISSNTSIMALSWVCALLLSTWAHTKMARLASWGRAWTLSHILLLHNFLALAASWGTAWILNPTLHLLNFLARATFWSAPWIWASSSSLSTFWVEHPEAQLEFWAPLCAFSTFRLEQHPEVQIEFWTPIGTFSTLGIEQHSEVQIEFWAPLGTFSTLRVEQHPEEQLEFWAPPCAFW